MLERPVLIVAEVVVPLFTVEPPLELLEAVPVTFNPADEVNVLPDATSAAVALPKSDNGLCKESDSPPPIILFAPRIWIF